MVVVVVVVVAAAEEEEEETDYDLPSGYLHRRGRKIPAAVVEMIMMMLEIPSSI